MNDHLLSLLFALAATAFLIAGCTGETLTAPEAQEDAPLLVETLDAPLPALRFTGRDSFGIALKGRVAGTSTVAQDGRCPFETVHLSGNGRATHMGRVDVVQSHCVDPSSPLEVTDGVFAFHGTNGTEISGTYAGSLAPARQGGSTLELVLWVLDGTMPAADLEADDELNRKGRATALGVLDADGGFSYELDGWLFHHEQSLPPGPTN